MARHLAVLVLLGALCLGNAAPSVHTVFATECTPYFIWQTLGMVYSHKKSGQPGPITRLMSCTKEELALLSEADRSIVPTHIAPSYTKHPRTGDTYSAYNKPVAVIDWLAKTEVKEDYILVLDADMIMREPFVPEDLGAAPGRAVSAFYGYLKGVNNELALKHVPEVAPRNDTDAGPLGRRGDQVGGFILMHQSDLRRMAPLWLKYSEDVRADPDAWELSGDSYATHPGDKPWISEMYGYSFGAAKANVWHTCHHTAMLYPGYDTPEPPKVLHYGLLYDIKGTSYSFDKHWHYGFDALKCPPWELSDRLGPQPGGLFPHPPSPKTFTTQGLALLRDLLALEVPITLNEAFCDHYLQRCPPSDQLTRECTKAQQLAEDLADVYATLELPDPCQDKDPRCAEWAEAGECQKNPVFMEDSCGISCKKCHPRSPRPPAAHVQSRGRQAGTNGAQQQGAEEATTTDDDGPDVTAPEKLEGIVQPPATKGDGVIRPPSKASKQGVSGDGQGGAAVEEGGGKHDAVVEAVLSSRSSRQQQAGVGGTDGATAGEGGASWAQQGAAEDAQEDGTLVLGSGATGEGGARTVEPRAPELGESDGGDLVQRRRDRLAQGVLAGLSAPRSRKGLHLELSALTHRFEKGRILRETNPAAATGAQLAVAGRKYSGLGLGFWGSMVLLLLCAAPRVQRWRRGGRASAKRNLGRMD